MTYSFALRFAGPLLLAGVVSAGACGGAARTTAPPPPPAPDASPSAALSPRTAATALAALEDGNARFMLGRPRHPHEHASFRHRLVGEQKPFATILGCSDSRVPPELLFDEGLGDLFVIRVAGNIVGTDVAASIEYAVDHLKTPLLVVLGHENCGAVTAALHHFHGKMAENAEPPEIMSLLGHIEPGLHHDDPSRPFSEQLHLAVEDNVRHSVKDLLAVQDIRTAVASGRVAVVGAVYDLASGQVRFLSDDLVNPTGTAEEPHEPAAGQRH